LDVANLKCVYVLADQNQSCGILFAGNKKGRHLPAREQRTKID
jgi:hypothetical protein